MTKILIVEDEPNMRMGLKDNLRYEGFDVDMANDGAQGLDKIQSNHYDLVLMDVMMPNMSGFDVCRQLRKENISVPIILLTAKGEEIDKVLGLELGADDYITKPFSLRELLARIKAILRRTQSGDAGENIKNEIEVGKLQLNLNNYTAYTEGNPVKLSHKEYEILKYFLSRKNQAVSRYDLLENIWGIGGDITTRTVDNFIMKLRQKLEENPNKPRIIITAHGVGYKLVL